MYPLLSEGQEGTIVVRRRSDLSKWNPSEILAGLEPACSALQAVALPLSHKIWAIQGAA
jgi:hypothetical protein